MSTRITAVFVRLLLCSGLLLALLVVPTPVTPAYAAAFTVNTTTDALGGSCQAAATCSLRQAILAANYTPGDDTIYLPAGTYTLSLAGPNEDAGQTGDLDIFGTGGGETLTIIGQGATPADTVINANHLDRVFDIQPTGLTTVTLVNLTVSGGMIGQGGGIRIRAVTLGSPKLVLDHVIVTNNVATGTNTIPYPDAGGGLLNVQANVTLIDSQVFSNTAIVAGGGLGNLGLMALRNTQVNTNTAQSGAGGGIGNSGVLYLENSPVSGNHAYDPYGLNTEGIGDGGGIGNRSSGAGTGVVTLVNSPVSRNQADISGGGIANSGGSITLSNSPVSDNRAGVGGGISQSAGQIVLSNSPVSSNTLTTFVTARPVGHGGGIANSGGVLTATNSAIFNNTALALSDSQGGGLINGGPAWLIASPVISNAANYVGGGISNISTGTLTLANSPVLNNRLYGATSEGGGIFNGGWLSMTGSPVSGNQAHHGGGMYNDGSSPALTNILFDGNAASSGGGMYNGQNSNPALTNITFSGNAASFGGGGMTNYDNSNPTLTNVTFSGNTAYSGGGMFNEYTSSPQVRNTLLWGDSGGEISNSASTPTISDSVVQGGCPVGSSCTNVISADPLLAPLGNYGGSMQTIALLPGSSAIDATSTNCPTTDQRGITRSSPTCDIGAFESRGFTLATTGGDNQSTPISTTFTLPLSVTLSETGGNVLSGASITFTAPNSGASLAAPITVVTTTNAEGNAARSATANVLAGYYTVIASASSTVSTTFALTNLKGTSMSSLTGGPDPSTFGQPVTFTATVTSTIGTPTGDVTFMIDAANSVQPLVNGVATYVTHTLAAGSHSVTAVYNGDANYNGSASNTYTNTVVKADTTTSVTSSPNPSTLGQAVTFTTTVTSSGGTPTGNVTLTLDADNIVQPLVNGVATYVTNTLAIGNHPITATYGGDANFLPSSQTLPGGQTVGAAYLDHLTLTVQPTSLYANGLDEARVTVTATTATGDGTPFAGRTISLTLDAGLGSLTHPIVTLDANGVATTTFTAAATPGLETLTATTIDHGLTKVATATLTLNPNPLTGKLTSEMGPVITYTFVITNASLAEQTVVMSGSLPFQTVLVSVTNGSAVTTGGDYGWGYVQAEDVKLAAGQSYTLVWSVRPLTWLGDVITQAHAASAQARLRLPVVNTIYRVFILTLFNDWP